MPHSSISVNTTTRDEASARLEHAREQLTALLAYGNDDERAEQARAELAASEAELEPPPVDLPPEPPTKPTRRGGPA